MMSRKIHQKWKGKALWIWYRLVANLYFPANFHGLWVKSHGSKMYWSEHSSNLKTAWICTALCFLYDWMPAIYSEEFSWRQRLRVPIKAALQFSVFQYQRKTSVEIGAWCWVCHSTRHHEKLNPIYIDIAVVTVRSELNMTSNSNIGPDYDWRSVSLERGINPFSFHRNFRSVAFSISDEKSQQGRGQTQRFCMERTGMSCKGLALQNGSWCQIKSTDRVSQFWWPLYQNSADYRQILSHCQVQAGQGTPSELDEWLENGDFYKDEVIVLAHRLDANVRDLKMKQAMIQTYRFIAAWYGANI